MEDFSVDKFYYYTGPNYYIDEKALVFNIYIDPLGERIEFYESHVLKIFPSLESAMPDQVVDLFVQVLVCILKMDIDLKIDQYDIMTDKDEYSIAVSCFHKGITEDAVYLASEWFQAMTRGENFDFDAKFEDLKNEFDKTVYGGPTIYSLIEAGMKQNIPVRYLYEENQFQWGYGKKQVRGRSTTFHIDSIKDTEFTSFKDIVKDFLLMCGLPTPTGKNCMTVKQAIEQAGKLGWPVVIKPLAGHKGEGVTTGITSDAEVAAAFERVVQSTESGPESFEGAIVENQVEGTDHRLLTVGGKFVAGLRRIPAYVEGCGKKSIRELVDEENEITARLDNARSPLCKIKTDDDLLDYLKLQNLSLDSIPQEGEKVYLRRVANISAGGVSIDVTKKVHPDNVALVENIAKFFNITCLGIDVLAEDIETSWQEGNFGIIEINAGPGVFMHMAPAVGEPVDVPDMIMTHLFPEPEDAKIPIISGNRISKNLCSLIYDDFEKIDSDIEFGSLVKEGVFFNGKYFCKHKDHDQNVKIVLRNPKLGFAVFNHTQDDILDFGIWHNSSDIVILEEPRYAEQILKRGLADGILVVIQSNLITMFQYDLKTESQTFGTEEEKESIIAEFIKPFYKILLKKYKIKTDKSSNKLSGDKLFEGA